MMQITHAPTGEDASIYLPGDLRRGLASVLADWLNIYAGMSPSVIRRQHFELVVELRRMLLAPDEPARDSEAAERAAEPDGSRAAG